MIDDIDPYVLLAQRQRAEREAEQQATDDMLSYLAAGLGIIGAFGILVWLTHAYFVVAQ